MCRSTSTASCWIRRSFRNHVPKHLHRVVLDQAQVGEVLFADELEQGAYARGMHFHAQIVDLGMVAGDFRRGLAHAEADFKHFGCFPPESGGQVQGG